MSGTQPFYFGSLAKAQYVPAPNTDMDASHVGQAEQLDYFNGGAYVAEGFGTHREFSMNWGIQEKSAMDFLRDYRTGINGKGLLYFVDPFAVNCMPPFWARPELTTRGGPSLVDPYNKPTAVAGATVVNYFTNPGFRTGGSPRVVRTNLSVNPRALAAGAGWANNNATLWDVAFVTTGLPAHPLGITTARQGNVKAGQVSTQSMSIYNIDGLGNTGTPERMLGAWVYSTAAGYQVAASNGFATTPLPAGQWTFIKTTTSVAAGAFSGISIAKTTGNAVSTDLFYVTGTIAQVVGAPGAADGPYFDGDTADDGTFDYTWTGTSGLSASNATAVQGATVTYTNAPTTYRAVEPTAQGGYALRVVFTTATATQFTYWTPANPLVLGLYTIMVRIRANRAMSIIPRAFGSSASTVNIPANEWVWVRGFVNVASTASPANTGVIFPSPQVGDVVDIDRALLTVGSYTGPYFDGETEFVTGEESWWNGVAEASTSTLPSTLGNLPNLGALYTIKTAPDFIPQRSLVLLIPEDRDLWVGFTGSATNGGVIRIQPINREGSFGVLTDATLLSPIGDVRLNHKFSGSLYRAIKVYFTSTLAGTSTINLVSSKGVYTAPGETPVLTGGHSEGEGHTGFRFSNDGVTMAYVQAADGHRYVTTAASFTEMGAWA